jgi:hypothetical protein
MRPEIVASARFRAGQSVFDKPVDPSSQPLGLLVDLPAVPSGCNHALTDGVERERPEVVDRLPAGFSLHALHVDHIWVWLSVPGAVSLGVFEIPRQKFEDGKLPRLGGKPPGVGRPSRDGDPGGLPGRPTARDRLPRVCASLTWRGYAKFSVRRDLRKSRRLESNQQPQLYESCALPLSYVGACGDNREPYRARPDEAT